MDGLDHLLKLLAIVKNNSLDAAISQDVNYGGGKPLKFAIAGDTVNPRRRYVEALVVGVVDEKS
ncbi:hypothetical protein BD410DRAFT_902860 [Rickenella mellea]|uniref:Uncharacterized protein n=1 Tax=Rickenella mellea TaxID=50990 RepID=A0A4Y7PIU4_9AGAM|nr:hypothetical protein BD410DRAFT_902860 [Rickenella mellea]